MITRFRLQIAAAALVIVVLGLSGYGIAVYLGFFSVPLVSKPAEHSARYYPDDVVSYSWMTLNPGGGQRRHMMQTLERIRDLPTVREWENDLEDVLDDAYNIEFDDVAAWVGVEMSVAVMDFDSRRKTVDFAGTVDVLNRDAADDFLDDLRDHLEEIYGFDFDRGDYGDFRTWVNDSGNWNISFALSDDLLVVASAEHIMELVLDRASGTQARTLAADETFQQARAALPSRRFLSTYVNYEQLVDAEPALGLSAAAGFVVAGLLQDNCRTGNASAPEWGAVSAAWVERGLVFDAASPLVGELWPDPPEHTDWGQLLPDDMLGFAAASVNVDTDEWRKSLSECTIRELVGGNYWRAFLDQYPDTQARMVDKIERMGRGSPSTFEPELLGPNATLADTFDLGLWAGSRLAGFDLEADLFDYLRGDVMLAVNDLDVDALLRSPFTNLLDAVAMLSYLPDRADDFESTTAYIGALMEDELQYNSEYVLHDGFLTMGTTEDAIEAIVARQKGEAEALASVDEYRRAIGPLPDSRETLAYVDLRRAVRLVAKADDVNIDRDTLDALQEVLSGAAASASLGGEIARITLALTLFPEE